MSADAVPSPVLHVVVVGFHHKKGCQVDYSYPPLIPGNPVDSNSVPEEWKHLPSLAIPDGAHNYTKDTIYFHLPSRDGHHRTVYGVACYRQMDSSDLVNKTADVTRSTVQKSVCVLSRLPLYGVIQAKLELITHAYFDERDFSKVELLEDTYKNLSQSMTESLREGSQIFLGMSCRDIVVQFRHKIVMLFKLILLERRVLFTGAPVQKLCNTILALLSLFPGMIEFGLEECASVGLNPQLSPTLQSTRLESDVTEEYLEVCYHGENKNTSNNIDSLQVPSHTKTTDCLSQEPESPEIPRDSEPSDPHPLQKIKLLSDTDPVTDVPENHSEDLKHLSEQDDIHNQCDKEKVTENEQVTNRRSSVRRTLSESYGDIEEVTHGRTSSQSSVHSTSQVMKSSSGDNMEPLADVKNITQLESVQTGKTLTLSDSVVNIEEFSDKMSKLDSIDDLSDSEKEKSTFERSLNLDDSTELLKRSGSIEELDSPESILKIDQEDCFSWEEDRLLLSIDHKEETEQAAEKTDKKEKSGSDLAEDKEKEDESKEENSDTVIGSGDENINANDKDTETESKRNDSGISCTPEASHSNSTSRESSPEKEGTKSPGRRTAALKNRLSSAFSGLNVKEKIKSRRQGNKTPQEGQEVEMEVVLKGGQLQKDDCGFPLAIFTKGCICHPYLSLQYYDLLQDINVRGFVIGATNMLFCQKKHLTDVIVEVEHGRIEMHDRELQRLLNLTTADLRFADVIVKAVTEEDKDDIYLDGTEWEGGDEWLQVQFKIYIQSLLVTLKQEDVKLLEDFGTSFTQAFKMTQSYRHWSGEVHSGMENIPQGHPYRGNLGVSDIRMRLAHNLQSTERGKKINAAVVQTGKYVEQAGKVVGGAITNARSAVSSWFSSFSSKNETHVPSSTS